MLKKILGLALGLSVLAACNDPTTGSLTVTKPLLVNTTYTSNSAEGSPIVEIRPVTIDPGKYDMNVEIKDEHTVALSIKANGTTEVEVTVPQGTALPKEAGDFVLPAGADGQPFTLQGKIGVVLQDSPVQRGTEACTATRQETVCDAGPHGHTVCYIRTVTYTGTREVEFVEHTKTQSLNLAFVADSASVASYDGSKSEATRSYSYEGPCY